MRWQIKCLTHISALGGGSLSDDLILFKSHMWGIRRSSLLRHWRVMAHAQSLPLLTLQLQASLTASPYLSLPIGKMKRLS